MTERIETLLDEIKEILLESKDRCREIPHNTEDTYVCDLASDSEYWLEKALDKLDEVLSALDELGDDRK